MRRACGLEIMINVRVAIKKPVSARMDYSDHLGQYGAFVRSGGWCAQNVGVTREGTRTPESPKSSTRTAPSAPRGGAAGVNVPSM